MKKILSLTAVAAAVFFSACSKEKTDTVPHQQATEQINKKLLLSSARANSTVTFDYNADRSIKSMTTVSTFNPDRRYEFTYGASMLTVVEFRGNIKESEWIYQLNSKGYMKSTAYKQFDDNGNIVQQSQATQTYNNDGQLIKEESSTGEYVIYSYVDGNMTERKNYLNSQLKWHSTYEYYTDKTDKHLSYGQFNSGGYGAIRPKFSKNLIKRQLTFNPGTQAITYDGNYTYELDNEGFVKKGKCVNAIGGDTDEWVNTFQ